MYAGVMLALAFVASSCSTEQGGQTDEEAGPPPREVTKEVTRTVTVAEAPEAPEAKREARAAPVPTERTPAESGPDYVTVADGALSVEVPSSWGEAETGDDSEAGSGWSEFAGESVDYSLTFAPSLGSWSGVPGAPGIYAVASAGLAQRYANEELVAAGPNDLSGSCEAGLQRTFEREPYSGFVQEWGDCGEDGGGYLTLAATPREGGCVVLLTVGTAGQEGETAGQHALDTFGADCGAAASYPLASDDEQYAEDSEPDPAPQYAPEDVPLTDQDTSNADECAVRGLDFDPESNKCATPADLEETCAALGKVRAGRGCAPPQYGPDVPTNPDYDPEADCSTQEAIDANPFGCFVPSPETVGSEFSAATTQDEVNRGLKTQEQACQEPTYLASEFGANCGGG